MQHLCSVRLGTRNGFPRKNRFSECKCISQDIIKTGSGSKLNAGVQLRDHQSIASSAQQQGEKLW